jgi:hypothetical protein
MTPWTALRHARGLALLLALALAAVPAGVRAQQPLALDQSEAAQRPPLMPGQPVKITLGRGESAYFRLPEGIGDLVAQTRALAGETDTVMALLDAQGRVLEEDDDGGDENLASRIEIGGDQRGPLFLRVGVFEQAAGAFELVLERAPPRDPAAPPRTLTEAATRPALDVGQTVAITLRARQEAYFRLPDDGRDLVLATRGLARGTDTVLALLDANGREIAEDDDGGEEPLASRLEVPGSQRRPLYVRAAALGSGGSFELTIQPDTAPAAPAFARSIREAAGRPPLGIGEPVALRLRRGQSAYFLLPEGDIAVLTRNLRRGTDTLLSLLDRDGTEIAEDDDGGGGLASRLEVEAAQPRPLFVRARGLGDTAAEFELVVERDAREAPAFATSMREAAAAPPLEPGAVVPVRLRRGQSAWFALPPGAFVAMTRNLRDGTDTVLELFVESGRSIADDDDGGEGLASRLEVDGQQKGRLFLRAGTLGDTPGAFDLVLMPRGGR